MKSSLVVVACLACVTVWSGCDAETVVPQVDAVADSGSDAAAADTSGADAAADVVAETTQDTASDAAGAVAFEVTVSASPATGKVPLNVTLVATVTGDIGIDDVTLQWYRGDVKLEAKTDAAWIIILVATTTMRVEATYSGAQGPVTKEASVTVTVVP